MRKTVKIVDLIKKKLSTKKQQFKKVLKVDSNRLKKLMSKLKKAKTNQKKREIQQEIKQNNNKAYLKRRSKFGIYEKLHQLKTRTKMGHLSKEDKLKYRRFQNNLFEKVLKEYERFGLANKKLDLDRVSVLLEQGKKGNMEKMSLTQLLNASQYAMPTSSKEFKEYQLAMKESIRRLGKVNPVNKQGIHGNTNFHLGKINIGDEEEIEDENKSNFNDWFGDNKGWIDEDELEDSMVEFDGDLDWNPIDTQKQSIGNFSVTFNESDPTLIEDIDLVGDPTEEDLNRFMKEIDKRGYNSRVDLKLFQSSAKKAIKKNKKH